MNGVLVIDKPEGFTSHDVVGKVRRILKTRSVGHTGTLDPFATGVLVVLVGKATRLAQFLDKAEKEYLATVQFGFETDTGDRTGERKTSQSSVVSRQSDVFASDDGQLTTDKLEKVLAEFRGEIWQTPPMYSAKKVAGKKLYELARKGIEIERQPVKITISELEIVEHPDGQSAIVRVVSSAGTYIRVLAEDIGKKLGTGAHLAELRRTRAGSFDLRQAVTLEELENLAAENRAREVLIAPGIALKHLPSIVLNEIETKQTLNGMKTKASANFADGEFIRLFDERENLIAISVFDGEGKSVKPRIVLGEPEKND